VEREDRFQLDTGAHLEVCQVPASFRLATRAIHAHVCVVVYAAGGVPSDVTLKLPCGADAPTHGQLLRLASPFFRGALEDMSGSGPIPVSRLRTVGIAAVCTTVTAAD
jgi:hypothetical protein